MKIKKVLVLLMTCILTAGTLGSTVYASTEDQIAAAQAQKQEDQAGLAQAQVNISSLESKKQELEAYLAELDAQYNELTNTISQLSVEAAGKEEELKVVQAELEEARKTAEKQYEAMKLRIVYMYEKGGSTLLETLLSSESIADFLNQAENISKISEYDRDMLKKYEDTQASIQEHEQKVEEESATISALLTEKSAKQQEVQSMVDSTSSNISSYISQISASQEEANALMAQVNSADSSIYTLMQQAAAEEAAAQEEAAAEDASDEVYEEPEFDPETDTMDSESSSTSSDIIVEEEAPESSGEDSYDESYEESYEDTSDDSYTEDASSSESSDSGQGTYLGNFTLTAYCNCAQCCGTAGNPTASGAMPTAGHTVAMAGVPFGTQLLINGTVYTVEDLGTPYGHVDIYCGSHEEALSFGLQYADVYQLN